MGIKLYMAKTTCINCGKVEAMNNIIWSDPKQGYICKECIKSKEI